MATEIKVPELGESITEATVANWLKKEGDMVKKDEPIVELDTEKVTLEVNAPADGTLSEIKAEEDSDVEVGSVLGLIEEGDGDSSDDEEKEQKDEKDEEKKESKEDDKKSRDKEEEDSEDKKDVDKKDEDKKDEDKKDEDKKDEDKKDEDKKDEDKDKDKDGEKDGKDGGEDAAMSPSVRRLIEEKNLDPKKIEGSGKKGRITKSDVMDYLDKQENGEDEEKDDKESGKDEEKDEEKEEKKQKDEKPSGGGETRDIVVPELGESVSEATIAQWFKKEGVAVKKDEALVELETEKVSLEVNAEADGVLKEISAEEGEDVEVGAVIGAIEVGAEASEEEEKEEAEEEGKEEKETTEEDEAGEEEKKDTEEKDEEEKKREGREHYPHRPEGPREERVKMSRLRQSVAKRLKEAQDTAAMLTTFNEVDMSAVMEVRNKFKDSYEDKHGVRLGFMSFFIKACIVALREIPEVNAEIDGNEIVYKNHYDIGVAVGSPQGLVVPMVRDADSLTFAEIEKKIRDFARQAHEGTLKLEDMTGGTFTISNGGVYGSMLSTPILNPPQSGILGMHNIEQRAMVMDDGSIEARPMMYLALSYDHRIVDGRGAVTFLKRVKECIEDPERIMLDI